MHFTTQAVPSVVSEKSSLLEKEFSANICIFHLMSVTDGVVTLENTAVNLHFINIYT